MIQVYHTGFIANYCGYTSTTSEYYIKPGPQIFIADWLSRHIHETNRGDEIPGMCITINTTESCMNISDCMTEEEHLRTLAKLIIHKD